MKPICVFVSHSHKDLQMATNLSYALVELDMVPFLAHSDITGGELWREAIYNQIATCDIFVPLLTRDFFESEFTEQEVGAAWALKKPILPLCAGDKPRGFITDRQYTKYSDNNPERAAGEILKFALAEAHGKKYAIDALVEKLAKSGSDRECSALISVLYYEKELTPKHTKRLTKIVQSNPHAVNAATNEILQQLRDLAGQTSD